MQTPLDKAVSFISDAASAVWSVAGIRTEAEPKNLVVGKIGIVEIRRYAPRLAADTVVAGDEEKARGAGFERLAGYIFGKNKGERRIGMTAPVAQEPSKIAMTTPVSQQSTPGGWRIRFFLPAAFTLDTAPVPNDPAVTITEVPEEVFAVLRFTGSTGAEAVADHTATLAAVIRGSDWNAAGEAVAWFYNPPWTLPPLRRNEVAIPVSSAATLGAPPSAS